jgi:hypothetical protein
MAGGLEGWGSDRQPLAPTPWDTRPTREREQRWYPGRCQGREAARQGRLATSGYHRHRLRVDPRSPACAQRSTLMRCVTSPGPSGRITDRGTGFREVSMEHPADTPVVERPASPIVSAPVATRLDAPLLATMFYLLGDRGRWSRRDRRDAERVGSPLSVGGSQLNTMLPPGSSRIGAYLRGKSGGIHACHRGSSPVKCEEGVMLMNRQIFVWRMAPEPRAGEPCANTTGNRHA